MAFLGENVTAARLSRPKPLKTSELADIVGDALDPPRRVETQTVRNWERGVMPTQKMLEALTSALGFPDESYFFVPLTKNGHASKRKPARKAVKA